MTAPVHVDLALASLHGTETVSSPSTARRSLVPLVCNTFPKFKVAGPVIGIPVAKKCANVVPLQVDS
ncbi:hypothetical protein P7K49_024896 [Saguinus oedipus]|uniref:Uncharacterized protein n=1 Tax=Saguinus oedipus TaxID=9490 RepID=A0ABQ9UFJ0_SAGOE|nr:hypothetical protein P7K49_024896 [Saguinus oedipus]